MVNKDEYICPRGDDSSLGWSRRHEEAGFCRKVGLRSLGATSYVRVRQFLSNFPVYTKQRIQAGVSRDMPVDHVQRVIATLNRQPWYLVHWTLMGGLLHLVQR